MKNTGPLDSNLIRIAISGVNQDKINTITKLENKISNDRLTIKLTEELGGTYKLDAKFHPITKRKIFWDGETVMQFLVTDYNDPHIIHQTVELKISELTGKTKAFNIECPSKFSIYTRRLFKNYVIEVI